jgi:hypothetical protein
MPAAAIDLSYQCLAFISQSLICFLDFNLVTCSPQIRPTLCGNLFLLFFPLSTNKKPMIFVEPTYFMGLRVINEGAPSFLTD